MPDYYTRTGDDGYTGLLGEGRVPKYHPQPEAVGTIDEATAVLGLARSTCQDSHVANILLDVQRDLYHIMAEVSATPENAASFRKIDESHVTWLEEHIDAVGGSVSMPNEFIVPGDTNSGAILALARTVIRRAERQVARLLHEGLIENPYLLQYFNRLSSLCFLLEIFEYSQAGHKTPTLAKGE
jgi:cob(I)alamin adenosyltransferase